MEASFSLWWKGLLDLFKISFAVCYEISDSDVNLKSFDSKIDGQKY